MKKGGGAESGSHHTRRRGEVPETPQPRTVDYTVRSRDRREPRGFGVGGAPEKEGALAPD